MQRHFACRVDESGELPRFIIKLTGTELAPSPRPARAKASGAKKTESTTTAEPKAEGK